MTNENMQATLNRVLEGLKIGETGRQLHAIQELEILNFNSEAIVLRLEILALGENAEVRAAALNALNLKTSQRVSAGISMAPKNIRQAVLQEIDEWQKDGLIEAHRAEVLRQRYDFDVRPGIPSKAAPAIPPAAAPIREIPAPQPIPSAPVTPVKPALAAAPRPTLTQVLFSETSTKIYLYLGALFVIVAAAILAALVEAARLPVLLIATFAFAAGAVGFKRRLPQPSFALAIVFSFLLPIDANVIAESLSLSTQGNEVYWSVIFLLMAIIWGLGTWFYSSRLFSLAAFFSLSLGILRFGEIFEASADWNIFSIAIANLLGLLAVRAMRKWRDAKFAQPLFLFLQLQQAILLLVSFGSVTIHLIQGDAAPADWIAAALTWTASASFYAASDFLVPFVFFPWTAAASLFLVPWLFLSTFDASALVQIAGFAVWGALAAFASEYAFRFGGVRRLREAPWKGQPSQTLQSQETLESVPKNQISKYYYPLLTLSLPLFFVAVLWGFSERTAYGFAAFLGAGIVYTAIHALRPRWYVWLTALLAGLGAYFSFFTLPFMQKADVPFEFQLLGASLILLIPELFFKEKLSFTRAWNWPPVALGTLLTALNLLIVLTISTTDDRWLGNTAIVLGVDALLFAGYALRFKQPVIGYFGTASAALSVVYTLQHFNRDGWLPALTALAAIYYFAGYFLARREQTGKWGAMLIQSGLALGTILSLVAVLALKPTGGWYALVIAALFAIEMFTRRNGVWEVFVESLLSIALILILNDFKVRELTYYVFGMSLIWLASDSVLHLTYKNRNLKFIARVAGGFLTLASVLGFASGEVASGATAICFAVYAAFFAAYAWIYRQPRLGYLSTAGAGAAVFFALDPFNVEAWLPIFTGMAAAYYATGFLLRKQSAGWAEMFRFSGLALGSLVSLAALANLEATGGWYAALVGGLFVVEMATSHNGWFEAGVHPLFSVAAFLILRDFKVTEFSYNLLTLSLVWLIGDMVIERTFKARRLAMPVLAIGNGLAGLNALALLTALPDSEAAICFGVYAPFYALYAWFHKKPTIGYASTTALALAIFFGLRAAKQEQWLLPLISLAVVYYAAGYFLRRAGKAKGWERMLLFSGLGLGTLVALAAPSQSGGLEKAIPIVLAATFYAAEAFARKNVWLGFPANGLYLLAYFVILNELKVDEPQFFSVGAAALGLLMHYLLTRAGNRTTAFLTGVISQLVLLGTSYIQMVGTGELKYFIVLFVQSIVVLGYGIVARSRSLVIAPIAFAVIASVTVLYSKLKGLSPVLIIGGTGLVLLTLGILAAVQRERITALAERFSDWDA